MFYYLYEVKNKVNDKIYVGVHKTNNLDDGYMGSGTVIKFAISKHGIDNFEKTILEFFETSEDMYLRESEIVTEQFLARDDVYNLRRGGHGGFDYINSIISSEDKRRYGLVGASKGGIARASKLTKDELRDHGRFMRSFLKAPNTSNGLIAMRSSDSILRRKETYLRTNHQKGSKNSQFGTVWIWHELIGNKKVRFDKLPEFIEQGWIKGRELSLRLVHP